MNLPPLPKPGVISGVSDHGCPACDARIRAVSPIALGYDAKQMQAYARTAVEAALRDAPQQAEPKGFDEIEAMATNRYKVVPSHESMFHRFAVVAGDGTQQLYLGREVECQSMAAKFTGAFLDGAFYALRLASPPSAPTAVEPDELAEFEAWATSKGIVLTTHESDGEYLWGTARDTWEAWRASKGTK